MDLKRSYPTLSNPCLHHVFIDDKVLANVDKSFKLLAGHSELL